MARTSYRIVLGDLKAHLVDVEARFAGVAAHGATLDLRMAAWTPGSYLVRDYARHVQDLTAADEAGRPLEARKVDKATWRVTRGEARDVVVRYRVYAWELTVRTNHVDDTHAFLNGAPTYLWLEERRGEPAEVAVEAPPGWRVVTGLRGDPARLEAADLDELIDSPIHAGPGPVLETTAAGKPLAIALWGRVDGTGAATLEQLTADTRALVEAYAALFGGLPYDRYAFLLMLAPGAYGGLEHRRSSALLSSPYTFATRKKYEELLELVSHEYFHLWNVKRIRPRTLGPFAYDRENYTRSLWVMEGVTSYYDRYTLRRAGLQPAKRYLEKLAEEWGKLQAVPGRAKQSLEESSFDAWVKLYRPDENTPNSTVSYYLKGGLAALCLDLEIRRRTAGRRSLDDVMRRLWREHGERDRGFEDADVQGEMERAVELDLGAFFDRTVRGREDPDLAGALASAGLVLKGSWDKWPPDGGGAGGAEGRPPWLGVTTRAGDGRLWVATTLAGGPGERAGLYAGDELVAFDGFRIDERGLPDRLAARRPGDVVRVTVFRRDELRDVELTLGERPFDKYEIVPAEAPGEAERALHQAWLGEPHPRTQGAVVGA